MGNLYIVSTPIGNLQDISLRAVDTLDKVDIILSEDTRKTGILLKSLSERFRNTCKGRLISYYEQNEFKRIPEILVLLNSGLNIALVSDAGTPTISDPGFKLVRRCIEAGIKVFSIPGPSSAVSGLVVSGLPTDKFTFLGFLPKKEGHRKKMLLQIKDSSKILKTTYIIFVAPHSLIRTLEETRKELGDIKIVVARELTKIHEEIRREKISESIAHFTKTSPKGEIVLLFNLSD